MSGALKRITTAEGEAVQMKKSSFAYHYFIKDHLGSTRVVLNQNRNIEQQNSYYPFGMLMAGLPPTGSYTTPNRYLYNGKELQDDFGLEWYDYGARMYDAQLARFHTVDPLAEDPKNNIYISPYVYVGNNPITFLDPNGMNRDWFQNELTGDVYYNSKMRKGDEGTGAMTGEGWVHMGENGMFSDGSPMTSDASILFGNQGLGKVSMTLNYDKSPVFADAKVSSVSLTGMFKGDKAQKLMGGLGYDFKPVLFKFHSDVTTEYYPDSDGQITITHDNSKVEGVLSSIYISQDLVLKNTLTLSDYNPPLYGRPQTFGPMYSIRNQSWSYRKNEYGTNAFGRNVGRAINWLEKNTPWKSVYEDLWKKVLK